MSKLSEIFAKLPTRMDITHVDITHEGEQPETGEPLVKEAAVVFSFSEPGFGFGEVTVVQRDGHTFIDGERMNAERIAGFFEAMVRGAILDSDQDPERHALYNKVMRRTCADDCKACR